MKGLLLSALVAVALSTAGPAAAFMIVPEDDEPGRYAVLVEPDLGDHVPLAALPPPYNRLDAPVWADEGLTFRWGYFRSPERGEATVVFHGEGQATISFAFFGDRLVDGDTIGAAVVAHGGEGRPLQTVYAAARVAGGGFEGGGTVHRVAAPLEIPREAVSGFTFFAMKYYVIQNLDEDGVARALRRAVSRVTDGEGRELWAVAAD